MWISRKEFDRHKRNQEAEIQAIKDKWLELRWSHERLLAHLGLTEKKKPAETVLEERKTSDVNTWGIWSQHES